MFLTLGGIGFVLSLQEGFYAYQFKRLGWTLISTVVVVGGGSGMLIALWGNRLWFFYAVSCVTIHNAVDRFFQTFFPLKTPMLMLKPEATIESFIAGSIACFIYFYAFITFVLEWEWMR